MHYILLDIKTMLPFSMGEVFHQFLYYERGLNIAHFSGDLNIPVLLDNGCTSSIMPKHFYKMHEILHKCFDIQSDNMLTRNRDIRVHIWVVIPLFIPHVIIHLQLMFNDTQGEIRNFVQKRCYLSNLVVGKSSHVK